jgi:hypothetical protein
VYARRHRHRLGESQALLKTELPFKQLPSRNTNDDTLLSSKVTRLAFDGLGKSVWSSAVLFTGVTNWEKLPPSKLKPKSAAEEASKKMAAKKEKFFEAGIC